MAERKLEPAAGTKAEALAHIRENRAEERLLEREQATVPDGVRAEPVQPNAQSPAITRESYAGPRTSQVIDLLKRVRPGQTK